MEEKSCFIIMPYGQHGSDKEQHYRALYEDVLKPTIEPLGYEVSRADDSKHTALITKEIILPLASADIVIADLSESRPNVLYELGVRHALRKHGTIVLVDTATTPALPFDIQHYRAIEYSSVSWRDMGKLKQALEEAIPQETSDSLKSAGNPVHEWITTLPADIMESSLGSEEGKLQATINKLQRDLKIYHEIHGPLNLNEADVVDPVQVLEDALNEAQKGGTPVALLTQAEDAARQNEIVDFLAAARSFMELRLTKPSPTQYLSLVAHADQLNLTGVVEALIVQARRVYPNDRGIRLSQLQHFAHSGEASLRERARKEISQEIGLTIIDNAPHFSRPLDNLDLGTVGVMLDTYFADELTSDALAVTKALMAEYPNKERVVRNYARALDKVGDQEDSLRQYRAAVFMPDADDTTAIWFGNVLHNREHHIDAAEVYLLACLRDPDDAAGFAHFADEVVIAHLEAELDSLPSTIRARKFPDLPAEPEVVVTAAVVAVGSCTITSSDVSERIARLASRMEINLEGISEDDLGSFPPPISRQTRLDFARTLYQCFKSELTDPSEEWPAPMKKPMIVH